MAEEKTTKRAIYTGPFAAVLIDGVAHFERDAESEGPANRIDELVFHKPDEFVYAKGEEQAKECPCASHVAEREKEKAEAKPVLVQTTGKEKPPKKGDAGVVVADETK